LDVKECCKLGNEEEEEEKEEEEGFTISFD